jgi:amino acid transporter
MQVVLAPVSFYSIPIAKKLVNNRALVIYGFILVFILQCFVGASLAEFVSAYPTEGGMYHWIAAIAPKRYNSLLSFATGWCTVFGCGFGPEHRKSWQGADEA